MKGATGSRGGRVNGIFEPTDEVYNDMPVYLKKGDSGTWLELVTGTTGNLRWYVKPTANRGSSSVCFGYIDQDKTNLHLPHEVGDKVWHVYDGTAFTTQNNVTSSLVDPEIPIPEAMLTLLEKKRDVLAVAVAEREALVFKDMFSFFYFIESLIYTMLPWMHIDGNTASARIFLY